MSTHRTMVGSFDVFANGGAGRSVRVQTDPDLSVKFNRGEVLRGDSGSMQVAMVLGIDECETHRIDVSESSLTMFEKLTWIRAQLDLAIEGCPE